MAVDMSYVVTMMDFFVQTQKSHGKERDLSDLRQNQWDMRTVIQDLVYHHENVDDAISELKKLILFYIKLSDSKTISDFFREYPSYLDTMRDTIIQRRNRKALLEKTVGKDNNQ